MWSFARWGGAFTPPLVIITFRYISWRWAFVVFGLLGLVWCFFSTDGSVIGRRIIRRQRGEQELLKEVSALTQRTAMFPGRNLVSTRTVWLLWAQYFLRLISLVFLHHVAADLLQEHRHQTPKQARASRFFRCCSAVFASMICGLLAPRVARAIGSVTIARRVISVTGCLGAAAFLFMSARLEDAFWGMVLMGMASFFNDLTMPPSWNTCMDIGGSTPGPSPGR